MDATLVFPLLAGLVAVALVFDFLNGLHDAANSIATIVSTRVLRPQFAVAWAAFFNFIAFLFFGLHVAETLGKGIIDPAIVSPLVIFSALMGAILWNIITWVFGIPSSSSHALIGGLVGAGLAKVGWDSIVWSGLLKTASAIVLSPAIGFFLALILVPDLKYPPNPPAVGNPETIGMRTELYFAMLVASIVGAVLAFALARNLAHRCSGWNAAIVAGIAYVVFIAIVQALLPSINEVQENFRALDLYNFRLATVGLQVTIWTVLALAFGFLAEKQLRAQGLYRLGASAR